MVLVLDSERKWLISHLSFIFNQNANLLFTTMWELITLSSAFWRHEKQSRKDRIRFVGDWLWSKYTSFGYTLLRPSRFPQSRWLNKEQEIIVKGAHTLLPFAAGPFTTYTTFYLIYSWGWRQRSVQISSRGILPSEKWMRKFDTWVYNVYLGSECFSQCCC